MLFSYKESKTLRSAVLVVYRVHDNIPNVSTGSK